MTHYAWKEKERGDWKEGRQHIIMIVDGTFTLDEDYTDLRSHTHSHTHTHTHTLLQLLQQKEHVTSFPR